MTRDPVIRAALLLACLAGPAAAQDGFLPNPLQNQNLAATCDDWPMQRRSADPRAMQAMAGAWEGMGVMPGVPGIMADTPFQFRSTLSPDGAFAQDRYGCFEMQSAGGMPSLGQSCARSMIYGEWVAHVAADGSVAVVTLSSGSGFSGEPLPMSCGVAFYRPVDPVTMVDQMGNPIRRAGG